MFELVMCHYGSLIIIMTISIWGIIANITPPNRYDPDLQLLNFRRNTIYMLQYQSMLLSTAFAGARLSMPMKMQAL